jgi:hypothetical protein
MRQKRRLANRPAHDDGALADQAQDALDSLRGGGALGETIQRCYIDMCDVLSREEGFERGRAMTASEFERRLVERGMPRGAVHTLTSLFEQVRYGAAVATAREQSMAIESLEAIVAACRQRKAGAPIAAAA